jgi:hypothetical protein
MTDKTPNPKPSEDATAARQRPVALHKRMIGLAAIGLLALIPASASANATRSPSDVRASDKSIIKVERAFKVVAACGNHCSRTQALGLYNALHAYGIVAYRIATHERCERTYPIQKGRAAETAMHAWALKPTRASADRAYLAYERYRAAMDVHLTRCTSESRLVP